jgi:integrase
VTGVFARVLNAAKVKPKRGFYALRHTFATVAGGSRDQIAVNAIMGHAPAANDMSAVYRERIDDDRLVAVTEHVRKWLFGEEEAK